MSVEIQTVVICDSIDQAHGGIARLNMASIYNIFPVSGKYPLEGGFAFYVLLMKSARESEIPFELRCRIIDADGRTLRMPGVTKITGTFPSDFRFWAVTGNIRFVIPVVGAYQLIWEAECAEGTSSFNYDFDAADGPPRTDKTADQYFLD